VRGPNNGDERANKIWVHKRLVGRLSGPQADGSDGDTAPLSSMNEFVNTTDPLS
jgi:hypothetical protein